MAITRVIWKEPDWKLVCEELYRTNPIECKSSTLTGIKEQDVYAAMRRVLPEERWRKSMNMTQVRPVLLSHLKFIIHAHEQHANEQAERHRLAEKEDRVKNALGPIAELLAEQVFDHLRPMLDDYLRQTLGSPSKSPSDAVVSHHRDHKAKTTPIRKIKVGVIGLLPAQGNDLQEQFPQFDFKFVEDGDRSDLVRGLFNHDAIFGLTQKMAHNAERILKAAPSAWIKYHRVAGKGPTSVKRAILGWMNT